MSDESFEGLTRQLDAISQDLRKFGRAALGAQAAAEACTQAIGEREPPPVRSDAESLARALLPVLDALDRVAGEAALLERETPRPSLFARLTGARNDTARIAALASGLSLLQRQLEDALAVVGVALDRRSNVPVDGDVHRVVETRDGTPGGMVVAVVRPGCTLGGRVLREADVIATKEN